MPIRQLMLDGNTSKDVSDKILEINSDSLSNNQVRLLAQGIIDIKVKYSPLSRYPMKDGETDEEYEKRANEEIKASKKRQDGEEVADYIRRLYTPDVDKNDMLYDMVKLLARTTNQSAKVTDSVLDNTSAGQCRKFVSDIMEEFELD